jgi:hypothetical protein
MAVTMENKSDYEVKKVFVEVLKCNRITTSILGTGEQITFGREILVNQYMYLHTEDFFEGTALIHVKIPPFVDPASEYVVQTRVEVESEIQPFCRVPLLFTTSLPNGQ